MFYKIDNGMELKSWQKGYEFFLLTGNERYFRQIFTDAYISERKEQGEMAFYYTVTDDDGMQWVCAMDTPYARVTRRIEYRLSNNTWIRRRQYVVDDMTETAKEVY